MTLGFAGLGLMGQPMALNLLRAGHDLIVYNRSPAPSAFLHRHGARVAADAADLFAACDIVILMLADDLATDAVLGRGRDDFAARIRGKLVINMGTHRPAYSEALQSEIKAMGGSFVEAPVSGSRGPAEAGTLVAMVAGEDAPVARAVPLLAAMCGEIVPLGPVPSAMAMKMAVNLYLLATVAALAEATNLAKSLGLDLARFRAVVGKGQLGSPIAAAKLDKMVSGDFSPQAKIRDVCKNAALVVATARGAEIAAPLLAESRRLFDLAQDRGAADLDMAAVITAFDEAGA